MSGFKILRVNFSRELFLFIFARVCGLLAKPISLWYLLHQNEIGSADTLARYFFVVSSIFIALNAESHVQYYKHIFGAESSSLNRRSIELRKYISNFAIHSFVFLPVIFVGLYLYFKDPVLSLMFTFFVLFEKIWDELQRGLLFNRNYMAWSKWFTIKSFVVPLSVLFAQFFHVEILIFLSFLSFLFMFLVTKYLIARRVLHSLVRIPRTIDFRDLMDYCRNYFKFFLWAQLIAFISVNLLSADKWIASKYLDSRILVELVLIAQFGSSFLIVIDNIFFARSREFYINKKLKDVIAWRKFIFVSFALSVVYSILFWGFKDELQLRQLSLLTVCLSFFVFVGIGLSRPFVDYAFWHVKRILSAYVELLSFLALAGFLVFFFKLQMLDVAYVCSFGVVMARLIAYFILCSKSRAAGS